jgi:hypothetical protein
LSFVAIQSSSFVVICSMHSPHFPAHSHIELPTATATEPLLCFFF